MWRGLIEAYRDRLPVTDATPVVTLHEGNTPLLPAPVLSARLGCDVYLKVEGANPTGSFKDRGMTWRSPRRSRPATRRSSAPPPATPAPPPPRTRPGPGSPARCWCRRARSRWASWPRRWCTAPSCSRCSGNFDDCLALAAKLAQDYPVALVNSVNLDRLHGQKTAAFEIVEALGDAPDIHCLPVGNAGNISAYWMGYSEELRAGNATRAPKMYGFQAAGAAPIVTGQVVPEPSTIATAIRIGNPASWTKALDARDASGGLIAAVTDREILSAYRLLAREVGVFVELGSAASVAGLLQQAAAGEVPPGSTVVCTVTGHGLKDPEWAISTAPAPITIANDPLAAARALDLA